MAAQENDPTATAVKDRDPVDPPQLTGPQRHYFDTFGFVVLRGRFAPELGRIRDGFDQVLAAEPSDDGASREVGPDFADRSDSLSWLADDPRIVAVATELVGEHRDHASHGRVISGDTGWYADIDGAGAGAAGAGISLALPLDPLSADAGSLRILPGTNSAATSYADSVRAKLSSRSGSRDAFGVDERDVPSWTVATDPGDVVVCDHRTLRAIFGAGAPRRVLTLRFTEPAADAGSDRGPDGPEGAAWPSPSTSS